MLDLLRSPGYAVPLLINLTGSVWFFLLIGQAGQSSPLGMWSMIGCLLIACRVELDGSYHELAGVPVYGFG